MICMDNYINILSNSSWQAVLNTFKHLKHINNLDTSSLNLPPRILTITVDSKETWTKAYTKGFMNTNFD